MNEVGYRSPIEALAKEIDESCRELGFLPRSCARVAEMLMALLQGWVTSRETDERIPAEEAVAYADQPAERQPRVRCPSVGIFSRAAAV
jgi:hypothetical protein